MSGTDYSALSNVAVSISPGAAVDRTEMTICTHGCVGKGRSTAIFLEVGFRTWNVVSLPSIEQDDWLDHSSSFTRTNLGIRGCKQYGQASVSWVSSPFRVVSA